MPDKELQLAKEGVVKKGEKRKRVNYKKHLEVADEEIAHLKIMIDNQKGELNQFKQREPTIRAILYALYIADIINKAGNTGDEIAFLLRQMEIAIALMKKV